MGNPLRPHARNLRKEMTKEERRLWYEFLKGLPVTVHRQKVIGPYIVDFYIASVKTVIELDGSQHYEGKGLQVLRYSNLDVMRHFDAVCQDILNQTGIE